MKKDKKKIFHLSIRLMSSTGMWETQSIPITISKTRIRPIGVVVYEEKGKGNIVYLTEYIL